MTPLLADLAVTARAVALAVGPLAALFAAFQVLFLRLPAREVSRILTGTLVAAAGLFLFLTGVGLGFLPFGQAIGEAAGGPRRTWLLAPLGILLGFVATWGEPAVRILADQVERASSGSIRRDFVLWAVCLGVAAAAGVGMLRIVHGTPLLHLLVPGYGLVIAVAGFSAKGFVAIAIDAGGVATGPVANTFLLALAFGTSSAMGSQDPLLQGFGLVALIAVAPVISVMTLGLLVRWKRRWKEG